MLAKQLGITNTIFLFYNGLKKKKMLLTTIRSVSQAFFYLVFTSYSYYLFNY